MCKTTRKLFLQRYINRHRVGQNTDATALIPRIFKMLKINLRDFYYLEISKISLLVNLFTNTFLWSVPKNYTKQLRLLKM